MEITKQQEDYMRFAITLAKKGEGATNPNPLVGAVIVKHGKIIGYGYHRQYGKLHAEREAFRSLTESAKGADLYVTLEPCCHHGKQPPCTEEIIRQGIRRVFVGSVDPNPCVNQNGIKQLEQAGIKVQTGVCKTECDQLNKVFFHYITKKIPYVIAKYAMTMDGKIATRTGDTRWISGTESRTYVHQCRNRYSAILVGVNTVLMDDPMLTCRIEYGHQPVRIICDTSLRTPLSSKIVQTANEYPTILATTQSSPSRWQPYKEAGCDILQVKQQGEYLDLHDLLEQLAVKQLDSIYVEGGSTILWSFLSQGLVQQLDLFLAPKIVGGTTAKSPVGGIGIDLLRDCIQLQYSSIQQFGEDIFIQSEVTNICSLD